MGTGGFFIGPGGAGTSRTHCVMYGGIIKKAVLKDLECEAREWKPDSIWHKKWSVLHSFNVLLCISSVLQIDSNPGPFPHQGFCAGKRGRESINSSSLALTLSQPAFPPTSSNSLFTRIAQLHHLLAYILQPLHFVLSMTSKYLSGCMIQSKVCLLPFLHLCSPWSGPALCSLPLPHPQFYASCSQGTLHLL